MGKHVHAALIHAWADGAEIETCIHGVWGETDTPGWYANHQYRIKDPYAELRAAAADPTKEIRVKDHGYSDWQPGKNWLVDDGGYLFWYKPESYEIRDKPKQKVKMWQWIYRSSIGGIHCTSQFHAEDPTKQFIGPALWTEIEVDE